MKRGQRLPGGVSHNYQRWLWRLLIGISRFRWQATGEALNVGESSAAFVEKVFAGMLFDQAASVGSTEHSRNKL
jgi:hypothetical protein